MSSTEIRLRAITQEILCQRVPSFDVWAYPTPFLGKNEWAFSYDIDGQLYLFVVFSLHEKDKKEFTIEIGWSKLGRFPQLEMRPCFGDEPNKQHDEFDFDEYLIRLSALWQGNDYWWRLPRIFVNHERIDEVVSSAIDSLETHAAPFFNVFLEEMGSAKRVQVKE